VEEGGQAEEGPEEGALSMAEVLVEEVVEEEGGRVAVEVVAGVEGEVAEGTARMRGGYSWPDPEAASWASASTSAAAQFSQKLVAEEVVEETGATTAWPMPAVAWATEPVEAPAAAVASASARAFCGRD